MMVLLANVPSSCRSVLQTFCIPKTTRAARGKAAGTGTCASMLYVLDKNEAQLEALNVRLATTYMIVIR